ncbi:MAG: cyclic nucleotide-binding domain-containing protein [Rhodobacteraceae bacterium]|nr:cyclic nucleotide-binding domain-containing protein [Paracoccaceae bacterium]
MTWPAYDLFEISGLLGVALYLFSYAALQSGILKGASYTYALLNMLAAALVLLSLTREWNLSSALIQISWITISVVGLTRVWLLTMALRFSEEEAELVARRFPTMRRLDARRLLNKGVWRDLDEGDVLLEHHQPVETLSYLYKGGADIEIGYNVIAEVGDGEFLGEMACLAKGPASATVRINQPSRVFSIASDDLRRMIRRNPDLGSHLEFAFAGNIRAKLIATNALLDQALHEQQKGAAAE